MLIAENDTKTKGQLSSYPQAFMTFKVSTNTLKPERNHNRLTKTHEVLPKDEGFWM
jgi:hypothetical protein